jgi:hypothetical protein
VRGLTIFAPTDQAAQGASSFLDNKTVLENHMIEQYAVYSTNFTSGYYTTMSDQLIHIHSNASGTFVSVGRGTVDTFTDRHTCLNGYVVDTTPSFFSAWTGQRGQLNGCGVDGRRKMDKRVSTHSKHIGSTTPCAAVARSATTPDDFVMASGETAES